MKLQNLQKARHAKSLVKNDNVRRTSQAVQARKNANNQQPVSNIGLYKIKIVSLQEQIKKQKMQITKLQQALSKKQQSQKSSNNVSLDTALCVIREQLKQFSHCMFLKLYTI